MIGGYTKGSGRRHIQLLSADSDLIDRPDETAHLRERPNGRQVATMGSILATLKVVTVPRAESGSQLRVREIGVLVDLNSTRWIHRLSSVAPPFALRLINGMQVNAPEVTVIVRRVRRNARLGAFELHL